ncbi:hypothetical protein MPH_04889 [Macrophomina phaseolina MS6]|uniref:Uncharacterized protein n=1 Tax=Macrophomina phaseolina (strain MS6) TaxID=1126212 RepID=K2RSV8_MACPH|nr:hypothetical protein MPH_04889 [Macrophomina phaseolina MS6]
MFGSQSAPNCHRAFKPEYRTRTHVGRDPVERYRVSPAEPGPKGILKAPMNESIVNIVIPKERHGRMADATLSLAQYSTLFASTGIKLDSPIVVNCHRHSSSASSDA